MLRLGMGAGPTGTCLTPLPGWPQLVEAIVLAGDLLVQPAVVTRSDPGRYRRLDRRGPGGRLKGA